MLFMKKINSLHVYSFFRRDKQLLYLACKYNSISSLFYLFISIAYILLVRNNVIFAAAREDLT